MIFNLCRVSGISAYDKIRPGQVCLFIKCRRYRPGAWVLAQTGDGLVVKKIKTVRNGWFYLTGSFDGASRYRLRQTAIKGRLISQLKTWQWLLKH